MAALGGAPLGGAPLSRAPLNNSNQGTAQGDAKQVTDFSKMSFIQRQKTVLSTIEKIEEEERSVVS